MQKVLNLNRVSGIAVTFVVASAVYLLLMNFLTGLRPEHWFVIIFMNILFFAGKGSRKVVLGFAAFAVFGILYDLMRAFPNYNYNSVDIGGIYNLEKSLFGINVNGLRLTPNEYLEMNYSTGLDITAGLFYINWIPVPLAFAGYLFVTNRRLFLHFLLTFLFVNIIGFIIYYIHPAAPPWYVKIYGFDMHMGVPGNRASLERFDSLIKMNLFGSIYNKNANVFAAVPSLHCAYPVIVLFYALKSKHRWLVIPLTIFMMGIWFAAVYSGHHYVIDVIAGIICAVSGIGLYRYVLQKTRFYDRFFESYLRLIT